MIYYAGIGSRKTPKDDLNFMRAIAQWFAIMGYTMRSGGASGADSAFEDGCNDLLDYHPMEVILPWNNFKATHMDGHVHVKSHSPAKGYYVPRLESMALAQEAYKLAEKYHPVWHILSDAEKKLMVRNVFQILGMDLKTHSAFVICWTEDGKASGGTGQAIRIANDYGIPVYNLKNEEDRLILKSLFKEYDA